MTRLNEKRIRFLEHSFAASKRSYTFFRVQKNHFIFQSFKWVPEFFETYFSRILSLRSFVHLGYIFEPFHKRACILKTKSFQIKRFFFFLVGRLRVDTPRMSVGRKSTGRGRYQPSVTPTSQASTRTYLDASSRPDQPAQVMGIYNARSKTTVFFNSQVQLMSGSLEVAFVQTSARLRLDSLYILGIPGFGFVEL